MAELFGTIRAPHIHGAQQALDSPRRTGGMVLKHAGTPACTAYLDKQAVCNYAASDGNTYTDIPPVEQPALVWTPYVDPHPDPLDPLHNMNPPTDYENTLLVGHAVLGSDAADYRLFWPAMYGGKVTRILAARSCDYAA